MEVIVSLSYVHMYAWNFLVHLANLIENWSQKKFKIAVLKRNDHEKEDFIRTVQGLKTSLFEGDTRKLINKGTAKKVDEEFNITAMQKFWWNDVFQRW